MPAYPQSQQFPEVPTYEAGQADGRLLDISASPIRAAGGGLLAALALSLLSWRIPQTGPMRVDAALDSDLVNHLSARTLILVAHFLDFVVPGLVVLSAVVVAFCCWRATHWRGASLALVSPALAVVLADAGLKPLVGRLEGAVLGFPSGLSTGITAVAATIAILLRGPLARQRLSAIYRRWIWTLDAAGCVGLNATIVAVRYHYATDVVGGCLLAVAVVLLVAAGLDHVSRVSADRRPGADPAQG